MGELMEDECWREGEEVYRASDDEGPDIADGTEDPSRCLLYTSDAADE